MQGTKFDIFGQTVDIKEHIANTTQTGTKIWTSVGKKNIFILALHLINHRFIFRA